MRTAGFKAAVKAFFGNERGHHMKCHIAKAMFSILLAASSTLYARNALAQSPPPYHDHVPTEALPTTLDPASLGDNSSAFVAYCLAARIKEVLYQEPCYCPCGKLAGHQSLLDCFTSRHGVSCRACQAEAIFCFEQHRKGRTPAQIREAMKKGKVWRFNLDKYVRRFLEKTQKNQRQGWPSHACQPGLTVFNPVG
jgi:hypothetical protein